MQIENPQYLIISKTVETLNLVKQKFKGVEEITYKVADEKCFVYCTNWSGQQTLLFRKPVKEVTNEENLFDALLTLLVDKKTTNLRIRAAKIRSLFEQTVFSSSHSSNSVIPEYYLKEFPGSCLFSTSFQLAARVLDYEVLFGEPINLETMENESEELKDLCKEAIKWEKGLVKSNCLKKIAEQNRNIALAWLKKEVAVDLFDSLENLSLGYCSNYGEFITDSDHDIAKEKLFFKVRYQDVYWKIPLLNEVNRVVSSEEILDRFRDMTSFIPTIYLFISAWGESGVVLSCDIERDKGKRFFKIGLHKLNNILCKPLEELQLLEKDDYQTYFELDEEFTNINAKLLCEELEELVGDFVAKFESSKKYTKSMQLKSIPLNSPGSDINGLVNCLNSHPEFQDMFSFIKACSAPSDPNQLIINCRGKNSDSMESNKKKLEEWLSIAQMQYSQHGAWKDLLIEDIHSYRSRYMVQYEGFANDFKLPFEQSIFDLEEEFLFSLSDSNNNNIFDEDEELC